MQMGSELITVESARIIDVFVNNSTTENQQGHLEFIHGHKYAASNGVISMKNSSCATNMVNISTNHYTCCQADFATVKNVLVKSIVCSL